MRKLISSALAGLLLAIPTAIQAQPQTHSQEGDAARHEHRASPLATAAHQSETTRPPLRDKAKHMEGCGCSCSMIQQNGEEAKSHKLRTPEPSEEHQH